MRTIAKIAVGALLLFSPGQRIIPQEQPKPFWQRCEDVQPWQPHADDGSTFHVCTDVHEKRWEVVDRFIDRSCTELKPKEADTYQHFMCEEKFELMIRPEVPRGKTQTAPH